MSETLGPIVSTLLETAGEFDFRIVNLAILLVLIGIAVHAARRHNRSLQDVPMTASSLDTIAPLRATRKANFKRKNLEI